MADLAVTAANVAQGSSSSIDRSGLAGATITAGQAVYFDSGVSGRWQLADNNSATAAARVPGGIALNNASNGQPLAVLTGGDVTIGAAITAGVAYYLSANAGGICPVADLTTGMYPTVLGVAKSATVLHVDINASGVSL